MFYVSGAKIYLATYNAEKRIYPEVVLTKNADGSIRVKVLDKGVSVKPVNRSVCTLREIIAQFGQNAKAGTSVPSSSENSEK